MDGLDKITAATAEDFRWFEGGVEDFDRLSVYHKPPIRVAAHYARRAAEAERLLRRWQDCYGFNGLNPALCKDTDKFLEAK